MAAVSLAPNELRSVQPPSAAQRFGLGSGENPWLYVLGLSAGPPLSRYLKRYSSAEQVSRNRVEERRGCSYRRESRRLPRKILRWSMSRRWDLRMAPRTTIIRYRITAITQMAQREPVITSFALQKPLGFSGRRQFQRLARPQEAGREARPRGL